jgi:hypothetical protein
VDPAWRPCAKWDSDYDQVLLLRGSVGCEVLSALERAAWVVERTFAAQSFRRLRARYDERADIHEASSLSLMCVDLLAVASQEPDAGLNELLGPSGAGQINTASLLRTNREAGGVFSRISVRPTASGQPEVCVFEQ